MYAYLTYSGLWVCKALIIVKLAKEHMTDEEWLVKKVSVFTLVVKPLFGGVLC